jgi:hypothetical protein
MEQRGGFRALALNLPFPRTGCRDHRKETMIKASRSLFQRVTAPEQRCGGYTR